MTRTSIFDSNGDKPNNSIKFLYSYGGWIIPRRSDGTLHYNGGFNRVLSVDRSISFAELMVKFVELCGASMSLKCKLPKEDFDLLISIKSDEDLENIIGEYDLDAPGMKIRAILFPNSPLKQFSPPYSPVYFTPETRQSSEFDFLNPIHPQLYQAKYIYHPSVPVYGYAAGGQ